MRLTTAFGRMREACGAFVQGSACNNDNDNLLTATQSQLSQKENSNTTLTQAHVIPMHTGPKPFTGNSGAQRWGDMSLKGSG